MYVVICLILFFDLLLRVPLSTCWFPGKTVDRDYDLSR